MKYSALLKVYGDSGKIAECFEPELNKKNRAGIKLTKKENFVLFEIDAKDSVALRATLNSITKLLTVYEKIEKV